MGITALYTEHRKDNAQTVINGQKLHRENEVELILSTRGTTCVENELDSGLERPSAPSSSETVVVVRLTVRLLNYYGGLTYDHLFVGLQIWSKINCHNAHHSQQAREAGRVGQGKTGLIISVYILLTRDMYTLSAVQLRTIVQFRVNSSWWLPFITMLVFFHHVKISWNI